MTTVDIVRQPASSVNCIATQVLSGLAQPRWQRTNIAVTLSADMFGRVKPKAGDVAKTGDLRCSFCSKSQNDVRKLVAGPAAFICDECIAVCNDIIADDARFEAFRAGRLAPPDPEGDTIPPAETLTLTARCALCKQPLLISEALAVEARGVLCGGCVSAVQIALAVRKTDQQD